ncbi:carbon-monoxide dehydrogenase medium subunit [Streptomyces sp. WMMB 714]|uniref:FAD binding domain-containing protein n=1 Tax=Streptomyces sp. WMMB 714 TaxID=1286822 RepID=UPI0005F86B64|nr:xanthine dehydrogenase family protein subunit M [Streptomyces sp. WMMB 714]SCK47767.1 carbon-monoxide dehydrogenase medium subunit [Streptomyces sp. WMMB 714]
MKPAAFTYHRARDVEGATRLLAELGDEAKVIAGGQSLVAMMNFRLARPGHLVDIGGLAGLAGLRTDSGGGLHIGALTTHHAVETAPAGVLGAGFAVLRDAMRWVGHLPIRTRGTVGGSLAHGDATAEWCLLAVLLDAELVAHGPDGERRIAAADFFHGYYTTALEPDEILVEVVFPRPAPHAALTEFAERQGDFATVSAAVDLEPAPRGGHFTAARVALGGVDAMPVRVPEAEEALVSGGAPGPELYARTAAVAAESVDPPSDGNGSAHYRRVLIRTLVARACEEAMAR